MRSYILITLIAFVATFSSPSLANDQKRLAGEVEQTSLGQDRDRVEVRPLPPRSLGHTCCDVFRAKECCCLVNSEECISKVREAPEERVQGPNSLNCVAQTSNLPPSGAVDCNVANGQSPSGQHPIQTGHFGQNGLEIVPERIVPENPIANERNSLTTGNFSPDSRETENQSNLINNCHIRQRNPRQDTSDGAALASQECSSCQVAANYIDQDRNRNCVTCTCHKSCRENVQSSGSSSLSNSNAASSENIKIVEQPATNNALVDDDNTAANLRLSATPLVAFIVVAVYMTL